MTPTPPPPEELPITTFDDGPGAAPAPVLLNPRAELSTWANDEDEWLRLIVRHVLAAAKQLPLAGVDMAFRLFLQEKQFEPRDLPIERKLVVKDADGDAEAPLILTELSEVAGVNALMSGPIIKFNPGLTILFGENGTGKTGYARILKALANSPTADTILPNVDDPAAPTSQSALLKYVLGDRADSKRWAGDRGAAPFTRMTVFDSPAVTYHVDQDLGYVYTPASLSLFNHVASAIRNVQTLVQERVSELQQPFTQLILRFARGSSIYSTIETLGAATDLKVLEPLTEVGPDVATALKNLRMAVAALEANTVEQQLRAQQRVKRVLTEAKAFIMVVSGLDLAQYDYNLAKLAEYRKNYATFRSSLFDAADLPSPPEETWEAFIRTGDAYRSHLDEQAVHDDTRCLYCRQVLDEGAASLLAKYSEYLADKVATDISATSKALSDVSRPIEQQSVTVVTDYLADLPEDTPETYVGALRTVVGLAEQLKESFSAGTPTSLSSSASFNSAAAEIEAAISAVSSHVRDLSEQMTNQAEALRTKLAELGELEARVELKRSWSEIVSLVEKAKEAQKLRTLAARFPTVLRKVTDLSKRASNELVNLRFEQRFEEECKSLRAPKIRLEFVGREGRAERRKVLSSGSHSPSKILSEGQQKVLAIADFLAEARLTGITAPIVFDDPVNSLDHRRVKEVAARIASLAEGHQVIVFTHEIFFTTSLLSHFEKLPNRCVYYQVTDDDGIGRVDQTSGPRWDTVSEMKKRINETIAAAKSQTGEARAALVRTGYGWVRSWCEVFVEHELLQEVTQRYQPQVRMMALRNIKVGALPDAITTVVGVFDDACRYIEGHSQPLATQGVAPTLSDLEKDWATLQAGRKKWVDAS